MPSIKAAFNYFAETEKYQNLSTPRKIAVGVLSGIFFFSVVGTIFSPLVWKGTTNLLTKKVTTAKAPKVAAVSKKVITPPKGYQPIGSSSASSFSSENPKGKSAEKEEFSSSDSDMDERSSSNEKPKSISQPQKPLLVGKKQKNFMAEYEKRNVVYPVGTDAKTVFTDRPYAFIRTDQEDRYVMAAHSLSGNPYIKEITPGEDIDSVLNDFMARCRLLEIGAEETMPGKKFLIISPNVNFPVTEKAVLLRSDEDPNKVTLFYRSNARHRYDQEFTLTPDIEKQVEDYIAEIEKSYD